MTRVSRTIVTALALSIFLGGVATITIALLARRVFMESVSDGDNPIGEFAAPFLAEIVPPELVRMILGTGLLLVFLSFCGIYAAYAQPGALLNLALLLLLLLTLPCLLLATFGTAMALSHDRVIALASRQKYVDVEQTTGKLELALMRGLQAAFVTGWFDCSPAALPTEAVHKACKAEHLDLECAHMPKGYAGLFCKAGAGAFDVDSTFAFQDPNEKLDVLRMGASSNSFAYWVNWACMPRFAVATELQSRASVIRASLFGNGTVHSTEIPSLFNSTFDDCYSSTWWTVSTYNEFQPSFFQKYPNGTAFSEQDKTFFDKLKSEVGERMLPMDPKFAFCLCSNRGGEALRQTFPHPSTLTYIALGSISVFFLVAFAAEVYLCCVFFLPVEKRKELSRRARRRISSRSVEGKPLKRKSRSRSIPSEKSTLSEIVKFLAHEYGLRSSLPCESTIEEAERAVLGGPQSGPLRERAVNLLQFSE